MNKTAIGFLMTMAALSAATVASSQALGRGGPPLAEMSAALGIEESVLAECMRPGEPPEPGTQPTQAEMDEMAQALLTCLNDAGADLTAAELQTVMEEFRPAPPPRG